jgi:hypothetical protein
MCWVWNAPATCNGMTRALAGWRGGEGPQLLERPSGDDLAGGVHVGGGEPLGGNGRRDLFGVPADDRAHPRRSHRARLRHLATALTDEHQRLLGGDDPGPCRGRDLADGVPGPDRHLGEGLGGLREELKQRGEAGRNDQRLGDRRVPDRVGVGLGAVFEQVDASDGGEPLHPVVDGGQLQPRSEQSWGL